MEHILSINPAKFSYYQYPTGNMLVLQKTFAKMFEENGYENTRFISKMTVAELKNIGVESKL